MAYVPSFEHDVFISYAQADNAGGERVTAFRRDLVARLTTRLGARAFHKPEDWVFIDLTQLRAGDALSPRLERAARRSAVMISLVSPSYLQSPWCIDETRWFLETQALAQDKIQRRLIPIVFNPTDTAALNQFPQFARDLLCGFLCTESAAHEAGSAEWNRVLEDLSRQISAHLQEARRQHGAVYVGGAYPAAESFRGPLLEELRGFRCIPENAIFMQETAVKQALAEAKLAVHFLGNAGTETEIGAEAILWSLEQCQGRTVGYLPPGQKLAPDEEQLLADPTVRNHPRWTQPECTPTELAQILTRELESFRLPDPATPIALACDQPDLNTVRGIANAIHEHDKGAFLVGTPDFLAEPSARPFLEWKKLLLKSQSVVVYWGEGNKENLDRSIVPYLRAAKLGRAWYVTLKGTETKGKQDWNPSDPDTVKILDEEQPFRYERLHDFLKAVREKARQ